MGFQNQDADASSEMSIDQEDEAFEQSDNQRRFRIMRLATAIMLPILGLVILSILVIVSVANINEDAKDSQNKVTTMVHIGDLVSTLHAERRETAVYILSQGNDTQTFNRLTFRQTLTDQAVDEIEDSDWPSTDWFLSKDLASKSKFQAYVKDHRSRVRSLGHSFDRNMRFYTDITNALAEAAERGVHVPEAAADTEIWEQIIATSSLLKAASASDIQNTLGYMFYMKCSYSMEYLTSFAELEGTVSSNLHIAFAYSPRSGEEYDEVYKGSSLHADIDIAKEGFASDSYEQTCSSQSEKDQQENSLIWSKNMLEYTTLLRGLRVKVAKKLEEDIRDYKIDTTNELTIYVVLLIVIIILSFIIAFWYERKITAMIAETVNYARLSKSQSKQLTVEKKKTEKLLLQLLPATIADDLKTGKKVKAEYFDSVSVCYLDIIGFVAMISKWSPLQVVDVMNSLYGMFDEIVERHLVYKMHQSNDVYGVASGLPDRLPTHAAEIANLLIELLEKLKNFRIASMPSVKIRVRCGAHTGSCAAGVIGTKQYNIFGETVKIASKLSRNGEAMKIQISEEMKAALDKYSDSYNITGKSQIEIYGKGVVDTYYLEGHGAHIAPGSRGQQSKNF